MGNNLIEDIKPLALDRRLKAVLSEIAAPVVADIGADHGKISAAAALTGRAERVYAVDISKKCLKKAAALVKSLGLSSVITVEGDGLKNLPETPDQIVIAGMGGMEIIRILSDSGYAGRAVLCPHSEAGKLREYLSGRFAVVKDYIVGEGRKFYPIIVTEPGSYVYDKDKLRFGLNYPPQGDYEEMLKARKAEIERILEKNPAARGDIIDEYDEVQRLCLKSGI